MSDYWCRSTAAILTALLLSIPSPAADWPQWGRDASRNAVSPEKNPPINFELPHREDGKPNNPGRNIAWQADLGDRTYVPPVIADGFVWVSTNARDPNDDTNRIPEKDWDGGVLMCFRESDGKLLWKHRSPRLSSPADGPGELDYEDRWRSPIGCAPWVEGDRLWLVNNRSEVVCWDIAPLKKGIGEPHQVWTLDMRKKFKVFPRTDPCTNGTPGFGTSVGGYKDWLYVVTRNSADPGQSPDISPLEKLARWNGLSDREIKSPVPAPEAPSLLCLEKTTGKLVWQDNSPGKGILEYQLSSPLVVEVKGKPQVIVAQGDGWLRSFGAATGKLIWKCDLNWKDSMWQGASRDDRNYVVATPVMWNGRIYVPTGRDVLQFTGSATLFCIDPTKTGDISLEVDDGPKKGKANPNSAVVWHTPRKVPDDAPRVEVGTNNKKKDLLRSRDFFFCRTVANVTIHDGLLYAVDVVGMVYCIDANTGKLYWVDDLHTTALGQPLWVDGKVIVTTSDGAFIYAHGKERKLLKKLETDERLDAGAVFANDTLFVQGSSTLFAIRKPK